MKDGYTGADFLNDIGWGVSWAGTESCARIVAEAAAARIATLEEENREAWDNETDQKIRADKAEATIQRVRDACEVAEMVISNDSIVALAKSILDIIGR